MNSVQAAIDALHAVQAASVRHDEKVNAVRKRLANISQALQAAREVLAERLTGDDPGYVKRSTEKQRAAELEANLLADLERQANQELAHLQNERSILTRELNTHRRVLWGKVLDDLTARLDSNLVGEIQIAAAQMGLRCPRAGR